MHKALDAFQESQKEKIEAKRKSVMTANVKTVIADMKGKEKTFDEFWEDADMAVIDDAYRRAARILSPDIARTYVEHLAQKVASVDDDPEEYSTRQSATLPCSLILTMTPTVPSSSLRIASRG